MSSACRRGKSRRANRSLAFLTTNSASGDRQPPRARPRRVRVARTVSRRRVHQGVDRQEVWLGRVPLLEAIRKSHVRLEGMPADVQCERLEDYPILDEMDWSEREWDAACEVWEHAGLRERIEYCSRAGISIFAARRDELPQDDNGSLRDYLLGH